MGWCVVPPSPSAWLPGSLLSAGTGDVPPPNPVGTCGREGGELVRSTHGQRSTRHWEHPPAPRVMGQLFPLGCGVWEGGR